MMKALMNDVTIKYKRNFYQPYTSIDFKLLY